MANVNPVTSNQIVEIAAGTAAIGQVAEADGANVALGSTADAAVVAGAIGTISAKLRAISRDIVANIVLAAGENHIGEVGGWSDIITPTLAVSTSPAYSSGDVVGGLLTLTNAVRTSGGTGILQSVFLIDRANQKPALDILIFDSSPAGTFTDNGAAPTLALADSQKVIRRVSIAAGDWVTIGGHAYATISAISKVVKASGSRHLYAAMVTTSTPTFAATTDLILRAGILGN